ncbi:MAG: DeoR/GlpR family DNA-binding transcription regulator [Clostridiales bacterium]|nr:DeoR/GlpR family DNA-binding transcription regulator [Clostridiales bacterium]
MLAKERQNAIVAQVNANGSVLVKELSRQFGVTEDSIRKDLTLLEKKGLLKKTYGGAMKIRINAHEFTVSERKDENLEQKVRIAQKAMGLIEPGDMIFLDISTSNLELAKRLIQSDFNATLVTNMVEIMLLFVGEETSRLRLIFIGGELSTGKGGFVGSLTNQELVKYRFDKAFMGTVGVDLDNNRVSTYHVDDATTKSVALASAAKSYMMLENRKLDREGNYQYAKIGDFTGAILDREPNANVKRQMLQYMIDWVY